MGLLLGLAIALGGISSVPLPASPKIAASVEDAAVSDCRVWMKGRHSTAPAATYVISAKAICFDGEITPQSAKDFVSALSHRISRPPPVVVIRSGGGEVNAGINMGTAVHAARATVVAEMICGSSCANYVLAAGRRKVVDTRALIVFHGGASLDQIQSARVALRPQEGLANRNRFDAARLKIKRTVARQEAYMRLLGISPAFFADQDAYRREPSAQRERVCPGGAEAVVFPVTYLDKYGYHIDEYRGPNSGEELMEVLTSLKAPPDLACYWSGSS